MTLQKTLFSIGIAVVLALFINVAFSIVMERPEYPNTPSCYAKFNPDGSTSAVTPADQTQCDAAQAAYEAANNKYNLVFFLFSLVVGVSLLIAGLYMNGVLSWGGMFAGLFQLVFGTMQYWGNLNKWLRLGVLGAALVILFVIARKAGLTKK